MGRRGLSVVRKCSWPRRCGHAGEYEARSPAAGREGHLGRFSVNLAWKSLFLQMLHPAIYTVGEVFCRLPPAIHKQGYKCRREVYILDYYRAIRYIFSARAAILEVLE